MARKLVTKKTPEERRAQADALQASIADQVEALRDSEQWKRFLRFSGAFHKYSLNNVLLILTQNPDATRVAGFAKWKELGRQVRKGETAIRIIGYSEKKIEAEDGAPDGDEQDKKLRYFPIRYVFDIAQTDPIPGAPEAPEIASRLTGDDPDGIYAATEDYLTGLGWTVTREPIPGETNGYTLGSAKSVVVDEALQPAQAAKTLLHETGHVLLHAEHEASERVGHRGVWETEAESVAYVVAGLLGMDTTAYSIGYVATWSQGDVAVIKDTAARVLKTAHTIADALTEAHEPVEVSA
jgi:antirestriction protein ArdC